MPFDPRSPSPRILCPSVTTMTRMSLAGQLFRIRRIFPRSSGVMKKPFGSLAMWENSRQA
jgi:hypothetical protein